MLKSATLGAVSSYHSALVLPRDVISSYELLVSRWLDCNGTEWTVNRLKSIYTDFVRYRAGEPLVGAWYKKNREGLPSGVFSYLFKKGKNDKKLSFSCSALLRSYTRFISDIPTDQQIDKFLSGVTCEPTPVPQELETRVVGSVSKLGIVRSKFIRPSYLSYQPSPGKTVPDIYGKSIPESEGWGGQIEIFAHTVLGRTLWSKYSDIFRPLCSGFTLETKGSQFYKGIDAVGKIGLIQEPGYKLRAVANPNRVFQVALKPLGDLIYNTLRKFSWDCTFDQSKGYLSIQQHLASSKRVHCVDLSGATDYFPLDLQLTLLRKMFPDCHRDISLFEEISRSDWVFKDSTIRWTRGQPLGLYPSFGSFALAHGLLLFSLNDYRHDNAFFVLGDDVVILSDTLALKYYEALQLLGCPISDSKSITSNVMAEFGGKLIFRDHVEPQLKWRQLSDDNFVDILRLLGIRAIRLLRPKQRRVAKLIWDIPDFLGGLGFNPDGVPLENRIEKYYDLFGKDEGTFLMSYHGKYTSFFMNEVIRSESVFHPIWDESTLPDLDQRSVALVTEYLPKLLAMYGILGTNLYSVVLDKDVLPRDGVLRGRRETLLAKLQSKLGLS